jgi:uncharacterized phage-associated protein
MNERKGVSAHDVARELRKQVSGVGDLKLHKLLYYCQGWHLAFFGVPMFSEKIEAWTKGPVVATVWGDEKRGLQTPEPKALSPAELNTISYVVGRYGRSTGKDLIRQTHAEAPWREASERVEPGEWDNSELTTAELQKFFQADDEAGPAIELAQAVQSSDGARAQFSRALESMHSRDPIDDDMTMLRKVGGV